MLVSLGKHEYRKQTEIILKLGPEEILSQLSEECCELGQAAQKLRRVLCGTTPVSMDKAMRGLEEEIGDVLLALDCVERVGAFDLETAIRSAHQKNERWYRRVVLGEDV